VTFTLRKDLYDSLAGWKWRALKHVMGDLLLGTPAGLDDENPSEKAAALRIILEAVDSYADEITDPPETVLAPIAGKGGMVPEWETGTAYAVDDLAFHQGRVWKCIQAHTSQADWQPVDVPALWTGQRPDTGGGPIPWEPALALTTDDQVTYQGVTYNVIQAHTTQAGWTPPAVPALFQAV